MWRDVLGVGTFLFLFACAVFVSGKLIVDMNDQREARRLLERQKAFRACFNEFNHDVKFVFVCRSMAGYK